MNVRIISIVLLMVVSALGVSAQFLSTGGEVVEVVDGKTVIIAIPNGRVKVELQFVEVPEPDQPMHDTVKSHLQKLLMGKVVEYKPFQLYSDRTIGRVLLNNVDISQQMLRDGAAWLMPINVSGQDKNEFNAYSTIENFARAEKRGVWSMPGLKPAWEFRADKAAKQVQEQQKQYSGVRRDENRLGSNQKSKGYWGDINPALGSVGPLSHGYNAKTRLGYVTTSLMGVEQSPEDKAKDRTTAVDITYYYKEDSQKGRTGLFVVTVISESKTPRFHINNDLILMGEKNLVIGKAKRVASNSGDYVREKLTFEVQRDAIEKIVNGNIHLKINGYVIEPRSFAYSILHNMLQVSSKVQLASTVKSKR